MEDLFYFQEIYLHTNNYDIINFKKILEINDTYDNIYKLKKQFVSSIKKNIKNVNYTCNIKNFILDNNIFVFDNIFQYISNFNFDNNININDIDYEFINKIYNIKLNESQILKKIYDKKIIIKNENEFSNLFKIINLKNFKYFDLFSIYYKVDDNLIKNISKIEESFRLTKNTRIFKFYKKIFANKNYEDDDLIYFLLYEKYELNIDNFVKSYNDVKIKHKFNSLKNFYAFYFTNFEKFNIIVSEKLFQKLFKNFDLTFFKNTYYNLLRSNDIN